MPLDDREAVVEVCKTCLSSLTTAGDKGRAEFLSTVAPRVAAVHARRRMGKPTEYEDGAEGFAGRVPWHADMKLVEAIDGEATVMVDDDVAMVWTPFWFTKDGELTHVGTNIFTLLKDDWDGKGEGSKWLIVGMTDTNRPPNEEDKRKHKERSKA